MADFTVSSDIDTFMQSADKAAMRTNMDLGTAATKDVAASGDAASGEVVKGDDTRLTDARTPTSHTHTASEITDFDTEVSNNTTVAANTSKLAGIEAGAEVNNISDVNATDLTDGGDSTLHYHSADRARANHTGTQTLSTISDAGTAASKDFPAAGDAAAGEVVLGNDSRLTDARTPVSHTHTASEITDFDTEVSNNTTVAANTSKLAGIEAGAEVNNISDTNATDLTDGGDSTLHYHSADRNRANHTGTQTLSTISDAGTIASQNSNSVTITGGSVTGITDLAIADGGTGASTASAARTNLEVYSDAEVDAKVATKETAGGVQMSVVSIGGRIDTGITGVASYLLGGIYTYSFWFKDENSGSSSLLLGSESWSSNGFVMFLQSSSNQLRFQLSTALSNNLIFNLGSTYRDGKWRQLTFVSDWSSNDGTVAPVTSFYIDGQSVSPQTLTSYNGTYDYVGNSGIEKLWIGNLPGSNAGCSSGIRGFRVFNRALSAAEVADLYESGTVAVADRWGAADDLTMQTPANLGSPFGYPVFTANSTTSFDASGGTGNQVRVVRHPFDLTTYPVPTRKSIIRVTFDIVINSGVGPFLGLFTSTGSTDLASNPVNDRKTGLTSGTKTILLTPSTETTGAIGFIHNALNPGDADFEIDNIVVEVIGCIADLPLDEGIGYQFHDRSSNHFDALASTTGVTHLVPKTEGYIRDFNVDAYNGGSGAFIVTSAQQMLPDNAMWSDLLIEDNIGGTNFSGSAFYASDGTIGSNLLICSPGGITGAGSKVLSVPPSNVAITPSRNRLFFKVTDSTPNPGSLNVRAEYKQI